VSDREQWLSYSFPLRQEFLAKIVVPRNLTTSEALRLRDFLLSLSTGESHPPEDPDDTPLENIKESLRKALKEASAGQRIPFSQAWEFKQDQDG
jgi:hypothetical protein